MAFRERMKVEHSMAEIILRIEMQKRRLHKRMSPINTVVFLDVRKIQIAAEERVTKSMIKKTFKVQFTKPDLLFPKEKFPVYLDGPPHLRRGVKNRDDAIDHALLKLGFAPFRIGHDGGRPSKENVKAWGDAIETILHCWDEHYKQKQKATIIWCVKEYIEGRLIHEV